MNLNNYKCNDLIDLINCLSTHKIRIFTLIRLNSVLFNNFNRSRAYCAGDVIINRLSKHSVCLSRATHFNHRG